MIYVLTDYTGKVTTLHAFPIGICLIKFFVGWYIVLHIYMPKKFRWFYIPLRRPWRCFVENSSEEVGDP